MLENGGFTPREMRLIALMLGGVSAEEAEGRLGLPSQIIEESLRSIRVKVDAMETELTEEAVQRKLSSSLVQVGEIEELPLEPRDAERREKLLLRLTIKDLLRVAADAELRAAMLEATIENMGSDSEAEAREEIRDLVRTGQIIRETAHSLIRQIRAD